MYEIVLFRNGRVTGKQEILTFYQQILSRGKILFEIVHWGKTGRRLAAVTESRSVVNIYLYRLVDMYGNSQLSR